MSRRETLSAIVACALILLSGCGASRYCELGLRGSSVEPVLSSERQRRLLRPATPLSTWRMLGDDVIAFAAPADWDLVRVQGSRLSKWVSRGDRFVMIAIVNRLPANEDNYFAFFQHKHPATIAGREAFVRQCANDDPPLTCAAVRTPYGYVEIVSRGSPWLQSDDFFLVLYTVCWKEKSS